MSAQRDADGSRTRCFWRALGILRPERRRVAVSTLLSAGTGACGVALLATSAWLISRAAQRPSVVALGVAIIGVRAFAISRGLSRYGERLVGHDTAVRLLADLRVRLYAHLDTLGPAELDAYRRGDLLTRVVRDVDALQDLVVRVIPAFGAAVLVGLLSIGVVWYVLPAAGLLLAVALLLGSVVVPFLAVRLARWREARLAAARAELSSQVVDLIDGAADLAAFGAVNAQLSRVSAADAELTRIAASTSRTAGLGSALITLLSGASVWAILRVGVPAVHSGRLNGPFLAVIALTPLAVFEIVTPLPAAAQALEGVRQSAARVFEVLDVRSPIADPPQPEALSSPPHHVRVRGLRARYRFETPWALDGIDLDLAPGRRVGIAGPSGAGKSTLAAVLLRLLSYESGSVTIDGVEVTGMAGADVRRAVGLADPETHVFETTLRENLLLACRDADDTAVYDALERARLLGWVETLPERLDSELGGHRTRMSGGQRQRLGIARILLADFPVLILDEPGEHLDPATADALVADLVALTEGRTTVLISHRLADLQAMDEILVLDSGRVVERGTHASLVVAGGHYARQWERERQERRFVPADLTRTG